jgi:tetratricopeptide (TPR) repeat protein
MALTIADYERAQEWLERLLVIRDTEKKEDSELSRVLDRLATLYQYQGDYPKAEPLFQRSLEISEKSLGRDHRDVATTLNNLAGLYRAQGRYSEAEPLYKRCLSIFKAKLPVAHPNIKIVQDNYDGLKRKMAKAQEQ